MKKHFVSIVFRGRRYVFFVKGELSDNGHFQLSRSVYQEILNRIPGMREGITFTLG